MIMRQAMRTRILLRSWRLLVLSLAVVASAAAQTRLPPAQPADWEHPSGPYAVVMEEEAGLPDHTLYHPADLNTLQRAQRLPVVAFSGPGCDANGTAFRPFFTELASHGFLLIVSGLPEPRGGSGPTFPKTAPKDLSASLDWATAESGRAGSKYFGRIDTSKVAVMGQSCGGAQALFISEDPRIDTIVMWNSTSFTSGPSGRGRSVSGRPAGSGGDGGGRRGGIPVPSVDPALLQKLQVPIAYFIGGERDILYGGSLADIPKYETAPVFWASLDIQNEDPHAGTFREKNGGAFGVVGVAWLKWRLNGDAQAGKMFLTADCILCQDPRWAVRKKDMQ